MSQLESLMQQITALQQQADSVKKQEKQDIINSIKAQIKLYGLTTAELGLNGKKTRQYAKAVVKYKNQDGATWTGRGKKPGWVKDLEARGGSLESFKVQQSV